MIETRVPTINAIKCGGKKCLNFDGVRKTIAISNPPNTKSVILILAIKVGILLTVRISSSDLLVFVHSPMGQFVKLLELPQFPT